MDGGLVKLSKCLGRAGPISAHRTDSKFIQVTNFSAQPDPTKKSDQIKLVQLLGPNWSLGQIRVGPKFFWANKPCAQPSQNRASPCNWVGLGRF